MDRISYDEFRKVDVRMGTVVSAEVPEWSHWVIKMKVDLGPEIGEKTCFSGIMKFFKPKDLEGKQFPFVINLEPKKVGPEKEFSEVMMIMCVPKEDESARNASSKADVGGETPTILLESQEKVENGTKVL